jgi:hypothetical protein
MAHLATKTLAAIAAAIEIDQGAKYRGILKTLMPEAADAYSTNTFPFRSHLGASMIGRECPREIWYGFRWSKRPSFSARMLMLFNRGHLEEPRMIAMLMLIGLEVWQHDSNGKQFRITGHKGHFGGSGDGFLRGLPDLPDVPMALECKTHNAKSFEKLTDVGVMGAKWEHFVQMQKYMGGFNLTHCLYMAVNKDTDALHMEIVQFDQAQYDRYKMRSIAIIDATEAPPKISQNPSWFKCKFCDHSTLCHGNALPEKTCRSCSQASIQPSGEWHCGSPLVRASAEAQGWEDPITLDKYAQLAACEHYTYSSEQFKAKP